MSNRIGQVPRSIKFNEKTYKNIPKDNPYLIINPDLNSGWKQNYPQNTNNNTRILNNTDRDITQNYRNLGFDFYNKNNLLLKSCNVQDIQYVCKNPVIFQEDLITHPSYSRSNKNITSSHQWKNEANNQAKTMKDFYRPKMPEIEENQNMKKSNEAQLNDFLFNYRQKQLEKKNKKMKFIEEMEAKINELQKQAHNIQDQKAKQYQQIQGILKISNDTAEYAKNANMLGKVNAALYQIQNQSKNVSPPKKITEDMELLEINLAIEQHHEYNDALLDQIQRVSRSKSKQKIKPNQNYKVESSEKKIVDKKMSDSNNQTMKRPLQAPPRPVSGHKKLESTQKGKKA